MYYFQIEFITRDVFGELLKQQLVLDHALHLGRYEVF